MSRPPGHSDIGWDRQAAELASEAARAEGASLTRHRPWPAAVRHGRLQVSIPSEQGGEEFRRIICGPGWVEG
jgi:hypothetical protein